MSSRIDPPSEAEALELEGLRAVNEERMNRLAAQGLPVDLNGGLLDHLINDQHPFHENLEPQVPHRAAIEAFPSRLVL